MVHLLYLWLKNCDSQILQVWDLLPPALFLPGHSSTDIHLFSHLKLGSVRKWGGHRKYSSVSLSYVSIRIYIDIRDKEWLLSLVSYLELVDCMDRKCHEIVYMKSWPNTDSKLWTCSTHSLGTPIRAHPICWNLLKPAWPRANPACAIVDACMPPQTVSDYIWVFVPFVISRGLHRGSLPKRDKLLENTHTVGLIFWGSCSPDCRSTDPSNAGSCGRLGWKTEGLSGYCHLFSLGCAWQRRRRKRTRFSILHCLSCDRVGRRFITTEIQRGKNRFSRWNDFPWVLISVLWEKVRSNATVFRRQRSLGMEAPVCADRKVQTCHQSSGCWRETVSREGIGQNKLCYKCRAILSAGST